MAAAINILFRGKYGWGFPVRGSFRSCFFVFNGGFTQQPNPVQYTFDHKCGWGVGKLCRGRVGCPLLMCSG